MSSNPASSDYPQNGIPPNDDQKAAKERKEGGAAEDGQAQGQGVSTEPEGGYPEQRHAGAVGLGPEYGRQMAPVSHIIEIDGDVVLMYEL